MSLHMRMQPRSRNETAEDGTVDQDFFPGEERATKNSKVFSFDFHSTSNCHELLFQGFAPLNKKAFTIEK